MSDKDNKINKELRFTAKFFEFFLPSYKISTIKIANKLMETQRGKCKADLYYEERYVKREDGSELRIAIYAPLIRKFDAPGLLWLHGGGYGLGIPEMGEKLYEMLINESNAVLFVPEYTLSVEKPYPAAINDSYLALKFMKEHAAEYMININQLMVGGESAGGGLTCALTLMARDKGEINIAFQMPLYPMIDDRMDTPSSQDNNDPVWNSESNYIAWELYLGDLFQTNNVPEYAAPSRAINLKGLPPLLTYVGSVEPFKDETIIYVNRLEQAGVKTYFKIFDGGYHAFDIINSKSSIGKEALEFLLTTFKHATETYFKENK